MPMKIDVSKYYRMPLIMGPLFDRHDVELEYPAVEVVAFQYSTDGHAAQELLPDCYRVAHPPLVTVIFPDKTMDWHSWQGLATA